jgi:Mn-dependent DtxR family transcriptional regulator
MVLTDAGETVAAHIAHRHELLTQLLRFFELPEDVIFRDVEGMEHHISGETLDALERLTRHLHAHPEIVAQLKR